MGIEKPVKIYQDGDEQAVHIPREFELPNGDAVMRKEGSRLIIEPSKQTGQTLKELLASWEPLDEEFPEIPELPHDAPPDLG